ncbi:MAG: 5'/3'-nucleotidase SurE [Candidatus Eisenbacteria bacterium]|nr:5'/3'-nucleotidase SurE [Candidatus Eisenbacteria bacterium]
MRILVTNDDGVHAAGLTALCARLREVAEVTVIAPERPRSACGHAITLHKPLRLREVNVPGVVAAYATNGTPADCVALGVSNHVGGGPDLVVSGINLGPNLGVDMTYSGTVAAAMEAAICGLPSFAISVASYEHTDFAAAAEFAAYLAAAFDKHGFRGDGFLNVNVPAIPRDEVAGVRLTRQGRVRYSNRIEKRTDPRGGVYYWLTGERVDTAEQPGGDADAIAHKYISVTPVRLDVTDEILLKTLSEWHLNWPD